MPDEGQGIGNRESGIGGDGSSAPDSRLPTSRLPSHDTDTLARRAYAAFYAALDVRFEPLGWERLRPRVQQAWRVVVETVREEDEAGQQKETRP